MGVTVDGAVKNNALALIAESMEVMNEVNWRPWRRDTPVNIAALQEEVADCLLFVCNLASEAGMTAEQLAETAKRKQDKNVERFVK